MSQPEAARAVAKAGDSIQQRLTEYASSISFEEIPAEVIHAAKARTIDTLGVLVGGFFGEPCAIARDVAAEMPDPEGATIIGTRIKTTPDIAAFVNCFTSHYAEMADSYHFPGSSHGHPSHTLTPVLAAAEHVQANGRDFLTAVVLAYEIYLRISDVFKSDGFDNTNFSCIATSAAAAKLLHLSPEQIAHAISMAVVPNVILKQSVKTQAAGHAGRAGVFAAMLAREGMEGPHLPFEGKAGWFDHVARKRFTLDTLGGESTRFKILDTQIKMRPANGSAVVAIMAAEKIGPINIKDIKGVTVEAYKNAIGAIATGEHQWHPQDRKHADHSGPYVVAATLMDGTFTFSSYNEAHLQSPDLRALMPKIEFVVNPDFERDFERVPVEHRMRITATMNDGRKLVGETGGGTDDFAAPKTDTQIDTKFRSLTEDYLGAKQVNSILARLWRLEEMQDVTEIPRAFVII